MATRYGPLGLKLLWELFRTSASQRGEGVLQGFVVGFGFETRFELPPGLSRVAGAFVQEPELQVDLFSTGIFLRSQGEAFFQRAAAFGGALPASSAGQAELVEPGEIVGFLAEPRIGLGKGLLVIFIL